MSQSIVSYSRDDVENTERLLFAILAKRDIAHVGQALMFPVLDLNGLPIYCALVSLKENCNGIRTGLARAHGSILNSNLHMLPKCGACSSQSRTSFEGTREYDAGLGRLPGAEPGGAKVLGFREVVA